MDFERKTALIDTQIEDANGGSPAEFDAWENKTEVVLRSIFGEASPTYRKYQAVSYSPGFWTENTDFRPYRTNGVREAVTILGSAKLKLEVARESSPVPTATTRDDYGHAARRHIGHKSLYRAWACIALDAAGAWKGKFASEIDDAGIEVDWTAIGRV